MSMLARAHAAYVRAINSEQGLMYEEDVLALSLLAIAEEQRVGNLIALANSDPSFSIGGPARRAMLEHAQKIMGFEHE